MSKRLVFFIVLFAFMVVSAVAPSYAIACPHMEKQKPESTMDSDCPMHKKLEQQKKADLPEKPCCNSASCKVPQTSFLSSAQLSTHVAYGVAIYSALDDAYIAYSGPDLVTPPPKSNLA